MRALFSVSFALENAAVNDVAIWTPQKHSMQQSNFTRARVCVCAHLLLYNTAFHHQHRKDAATAAAAVTTPNWRPTESEREQKTESEIDCRIPIMLSAPRVCSRLFFLSSVVFSSWRCFFPFLLSFVLVYERRCRTQLTHTLTRNSKLNETNYRQFFDDEGTHDWRREKKRQMKWNDLVNRVLHPRCCTTLTRAVLNRNRWLRVCQNSRCITQQNGTKKLEQTSEREKIGDTHTHTQSHLSYADHLRRLKKIMVHKIQAIFGT